MIVISAYTMEDIAAIALKKSALSRLHTVIDADYYAPSPAADEEFKKYLEKRAHDADFKMYVAKDNDRCVGYVMGWIEQRPPIYRKRTVGYLSNIFVDEDCQKRDVGARLCGELEKWFQERNVDFIETRADARNSAAIKSFKKYGFKELSVTFYKSGNQ